MYACATVLLTAGCAAEGDAPAAVTPDAAEAVSFATDLGDGDATARDGETTRAYKGTINNLAALKAVPEGFGVFGYLTDGSLFDTKFPDAASYTSFADFFMQNQQVTWGVQWVENADDGNDENDVIHRDWVYAPLKYWPNSTNNATPRYISFFAYAPYVAEAGGESGVVNFTRDDDRTPHVHYKIGGGNEQVDLLWANCMDATRNGNGLITLATTGSSGTTTLEYQKVPLSFHHALAALDVYVQRVYDEPAYTGKKPDTEQNTKLFVGKLELTSKTPVVGYNALQTSGKLSLIDGTWSSDGTWKTHEDDDVTITYSEGMFNDTIQGTTLADEAYIRSAELDKWGTDIYGVDENETYLMRNQATQMLLPRRVTLVPTLTYSMVTRDDDLMINYLTDSDGHRYSRIVNTVEGNSVTLDLVAGKRYTLLIRIGVEHVTFEVVSVVDWDFPMRYTPKIITDFEPETVGKKLDEDEGK